MVRKGTKLYSVLNCKCPHCQEGDFFEGSRFNARVKEQCDVCGEKYSKEPGFYQGSYYVTYALGVAIFVTIWVAINVLFPGISTTAKIIVILSGIVLMTPFSYYLSKIIWANFFFHYKKQSKNERVNS